MIFGFYLNFRIILSKRKKNALKINEEIKKLSTKLFEINHHTRFIFWNSNRGATIICSYVCVVYNSLSTSVISVCGFYQSTSMTQTYPSKIVNDFGQIVNDFGVQSLTISCE